MKELLQKLNGKIKFAENFFRFGLAFVFVISCAVYASAQLRPAPPLPRPIVKIQPLIKSPFGNPPVVPSWQVQQERYKQLQRQMEINAFTSKIMQSLFDRINDQKKPLQFSPDVYKPTAAPLPKFDAGSLSAAKPQVVVTSTLPAPVQTAYKSSAKSNPTPSASPANSGIQAIPSLSFAGDLGNGTIIVKDADGKLYAVRLTDSGSVRQNVQTVKARPRRARK